MNEQKQEKQFIIIQDKFWQSVLTDTYSTITLIIALLINHYLLNDSTFGAWLLGLILFFSMMGRINSKSIRLKGEKELREYLESLINK